MLAMSGLVQNCLCKTKVHLWLRVLHPQMILLCWDMGSLPVQNLWGRSEGLGVLSPREGGNGFGSVHRVSPIAVFVLPALLDRCRFPMLTSTPAPTLEEECQVPIDGYVLWGPKLLGTRSVNAGIARLGAERDASERACA